MSSRMIFNHENADRFIVGTVGAPGERAFFLQVTSEIGSTTVAIEKNQVAAVAERLNELIAELRRNSLASLDELGLASLNDYAPLDFPIDEEFKSGVIGISWDQEQQRICVEVQALTDGEFDDLLSEDEDLNEIEDPPDLLRFKVRISQARGFISRTKKILESGRQPCPFCGLPIDPTGHLCPRANGYRR